MTRYQVLETSKSAHCCFEATVVDTARPEMLNGEPWIYNGVPQFESVCECFAVEDARRIADALNAKGEA